MDRQFMETIDASKRIANDISQIKDSERYTVAKRAYRRYLGILEHKHLNELTHSTNEKLSDFYKPNVTTLLKFLNNNIFTLKFDTNKEHIVHFVRDLRIWEAYDTSKEKIDNFFGFLKEIDENGTLHPKGPMT